MNENHNDAASDASRERLGTLAMAAPAGDRRGFASATSTTLPDLPDISVVAMGHAYCGTRLFERVRRLAELDFRFVDMTRPSAFSCSARSGKALAIPPSCVNPCNGGGAIPSHV